MWVNRCPWEEAEKGKAGWCSRPLNTCHCGDRSPISAGVEGDRGLSPPWPQSILLQGSWGGQGDLLETRFLVMWGKGASECSRSGRVGPAPPPLPDTRLSPIRVSGPFVEQGAPESLLSPPVSQSLVPGCCPEPFSTVRFCWEGAGKRERLTWGRGRRPERGSGSVPLTSERWKLYFADHDHEKAAIGLLASEGAHDSFGVGWHSLVKLSPCHLCPHPLAPGDPHPHCIPPA